MSTSMSLPRTLVDVLGLMPVSLLFAFLDVRDAQRLLATCRALRLDDAVTLAALQMPRMTRHFHHQCAYDWCLRTPKWCTTIRALSNVGSADSYVDEEGAGVVEEWEDERACGCQQEHNDFSLDDNARRWELAVQRVPRAQRAPLLSTIRFFAEQIVPRCYSVRTVGARQYVFRPVLWQSPSDWDPDADMNNDMDDPDELSFASTSSGSEPISGSASESTGSANTSPWVHASLCPPSVFGAHWDSIDATTGECALCSTVQQHVQAYRHQVACMVNAWKAAVQQQIPRWKAQGCSAMDIDRQAYELRATMVPLDHFYRTSISRRHDDIVIQHCASLWVKQGIYRRGVHATSNANANANENPPAFRGLDHIQGILKPARDECAAQWRPLKQALGRQLGEMQRAAFASGCDVDDDTWGRTTRTEVVTTTRWRHGVPFECGVLIMERSFQHQLRDGELLARIA